PARPWPVVQVRREPVLRIPDRRIQRHQLVIIALEERVELVVVAAGALDRYSEQRGEAGFHRLLLRVEVLVDLINSLIVSNIGRSPQESGSGQRLDLVGRRQGKVLVINELVAGHLLQNELV